MRVEQARRNTAKVLRAAVRLKYMLLADEEIDELLPGVLAKFDRSVLRGELPDPVDIKKALR